VRKHRCRTAANIGTVRPDNRPGTGSGEFLLDELRRLPWTQGATDFERRVRARQQIGDLSRPGVTPIRHRRVANARRSSSEKSCGSSHAAK
jgi:hypothetical protein